MLTITNVYGWDSRCHKWRVCKSLGVVNAYVFFLQTTVSHLHRIAVFTIFSAVTRKKIFEKVIGEVTDEVVIKFTHDDTVNLPVGRYLWDIKIYNKLKFE